MRWYASESGMPSARRPQFRVSTRKLLLERRPQLGETESDGGAIVERLAAVDIFAPLSSEETVMLLTRDKPRFAPEKL